VIGLPPSNECATGDPAEPRAQVLQVLETARIAITSEAPVMSKPDSRG
jgi:hypothetical protein